MLLTTSYCSSESSVPATRTGPPAVAMPNSSRHCLTCLSCCMTSASRLTYSSSSISPISSDIWRRIKSSFIGVSSVSSSRTTRSTLSSVHFVPLIGPRNGARRMLVSRPMGLASFSGRLLQLQLDVDEVVRWPRAGVLEGEKLFVLAADLLHFVIERLLVISVDEKGGVENHPVTDDLVAPACDRRRLQGFMDVG